MHELSQKFITLTGREAFNWVSEPTPATTRVAFGDGTVCTSLFEAHDYLVFLVDVAENHPDQLPYPFDQQLTPAQDLRTR